ncbi:Pr6Pr family membrane protein [Isoptericola sp. NPDC056134]|uniref:Pr6Pr family membrane protein n=1 Tax=Isoptericola sp. NPDC056134 TaxID=3345723 RepID=UPI0035E50F39
MSRRAAGAAHLLVAVPALGGVLMELVVALVDGPGAAGTMAERLVRLFSYFTILSNVGIGVVSVLLAVDPTRDGRLLRVAHLDALLCIVVTGIVYNTVLAGTVEGLTQAGQLSNALLHVASPVLAVVVWLLAGPRPRVDARTVGWSVVGPLAWIAYSFVRGGMVGWYPYPFLDVGALGLARALVNAGLVAAMFLLLALVARWADRRLPAAPGGR